jgi:hypothetical protein
MSALKLTLQRSAPTALLALCLLAGGVGAKEQFWPMESELVYNDGDAATVFHDTGGHVAISNTPDYVDVYVDPGTDLRIGDVAIHVVDDVADFSDLLDKKGNLKVPLFRYRTSYLDSYGYFAEGHTERIDIKQFDVGFCPESGGCSNHLYVIVAADLFKRIVDSDGGESFEKLPETVYAAGVSAYKASYVDYPLAKVEPGHFVDANVNGLGYTTVTQAGTTGNEGQFWFLPGEQISFFVGKLFLGETLAGRAVSPPDLFEGADLDDDRTLNLARLLQSLDSDGNAGHGAINISAEVAACVNTALAGLPPVAPPDEFFADDGAVSALIGATHLACDGVELTAVSKEEARDNLVSGMQAGNIMKRNISKTPGMKSDKAKIDIMPVYVPALTSDGSSTTVTYYDEDGGVIEERGVAKPIVVTYLDQVEGTGASDVFIAISRDDGDTWKRRNISRTAERSSMLGYAGDSSKPMLGVKGNKIFVAWLDKYCHGGRPGYAITACPDTDGDGSPDPCEICRDTAEGTVCRTDYPGDDAYLKDDLFGVAGPQRSVIYPDYPEMGEVPYSCVWAARGMIDESGDIQWLKPERLTSGRRDANQLFAGASDVGFAIVWQEDPKGLRPGEGEGPGEGWSGARSSNKTDIWYSSITMADFDKVDYLYSPSKHGDEDLVDVDPELMGRAKALVPMSLPVRISDNDVCSLENILLSGGQGEHDLDQESDHDVDQEGAGTHRYCGTVDGIGTEDAPGTNPLCAYTVPKTNPNGVVHNVCVTADGRFLDGNTGASRANVFLQPYTMASGAKSAWVIIGYEESKGVGIPPLHDDEEEGCGTDEEDDHEEKYKPDEGKNVIYHSFDLLNPETAAGGKIVNLPETDASGNPVYVTDEFGELLLDWKGVPQLAYENARRVRFILQPKSKAGPSGTVLVALYRQGEEGKGKPADVFMRRVLSPKDQKGNPYAAGNFEPGVQNLSSVTPEVMWQDPYDEEKPNKMLRWSWNPGNLDDPSGKVPYTDAIAQRGALNGDELLIGYSWTPNWGRRGNDKYDFYVRRSFNGGKDWTTDPDGEPIEHNVVFRNPVATVDEYGTPTIEWVDEVVTTTYAPGATEPARNVSNLRNNRLSVLEPRLVKTPGSITSSYNFPEDIQDTSVYQLAYGTEFNQNILPEGVEYPKIPLDIFYSRTTDKGQQYKGVVVTPQGGSGQAEEGWNPLAQDKPEEGAAQVRQTPDGSRMYAIWLEEGPTGSDIIFRRVDYRGASN